MNTRSYWGPTSHLESRAGSWQPAAARRKTARWGQLARPALFCLLFCAVCLSAQSQSYSIDWHDISGGGGTSTGATYQVSGTIGQPDAGSAMSGGQYSVTGGFWSLIAVVQTAGLPNLCIAHSSNSVIVSWPNTTNCTLQTNNNIVTASDWNAYSGCCFGKSA